MFNEGASRLAQSKLNMKKNTAVKVRACLALTLVSLTIGTTQYLRAEPSIRTGFFILPASTSPSNPYALQNIYNFVGKGWVTGDISTNIAIDPAALNRPRVLRGCQIITTPANLYTWDGTNNPSGNFANQNGSRLGWALDWYDTNAFLASDIYFHVRSSDSTYDTMEYSGNIATNGVLPLAFSSTLVGEVWSNGVLAASYHAGEAVATHPVNRVIGLIRESYFATNMDQVVMWLAYVKGSKDFTNYIVFSMLDYEGRVIAGATNQISTRFFLNPAVFWSQSEQRSYVGIEGQRQMDFTYYLQGTNRLDHPVTWATPWPTIACGPEGVFNGGTNSPYYFFRAVESNGIATPFSPSLRQLAGEKPIVPAMVSMNGEEVVNGN